LGTGGPVIFVHVIVGNQATQQWKQFFLWKKGYIFKPKKMQSLIMNNLDKLTLLQVRVSLVPVRFLGGFIVIYSQEGFSLLNHLNCHKLFFFVT